MIRAFLAFDLPDTIRSALAVQQFLLPLPRREPLPNLHLTLTFLGEVPEDVLETLHHDLLRLHAPAPEIRLYGFGLFGGDRARLAYAAVQPDPALMALQSRLDSLARHAGCPVEARRYTPHITLGRFPPPKGAEAMRLERALAETPLQAAFRPTEITLFRSQRSHAGSVYEVLAVYPLA